MKRGISILLLSCFTLYHFGFYIYYFSYKYKIEADWSTGIYNGDLSHHNGRLVAIPLSVPYMAEQEEFQHANVPFEENGVQFRVIKQRYVNDTLQIIFVPDLALGKLDHTMRGWLGSLIDGFGKKTDPNQPVVKNFAKDYLSPHAGTTLLLPVASVVQDPPILVIIYQKVYIDLATPPPKIS